MTGLQLSTESAISKDLKLPKDIAETEFVPEAYKHRDAFLRKLLTVSATDDIAKAVRNILDVLLSDPQLNIDYASLLQWSSSRKQLSYLGTNVPSKYAQALLGHINMICKGTKSADLSAYVNNNKDLLKYSSARERNICLEYYVPLFFGEKFIGALYLETSSEDYEQLLDLQVFELLFINFGLVLNNILLIQHVLRESNIDGLTDLYNRRYMDAYMDSLSLVNDTYAVLMIDIDHFKEINDTYGHRVGDIVLSTVAGVLKSSIRESTDSAFRYGGEEFMLVLRSITLDEAVAKAEELRSSIESLEIFYSKTDFLHLTISIGVASGLDVRPKKAVNNADDALYQAKEEGRNCVRKFGVN